MFVKIDSFQTAEQNVEKMLKIKTIKVDFQRFFPHFALRFENYRNYRGLEDLIYVAHMKGEQKKLNEFTEQKSVQKKSE